ncbi:MAG: hypothetical protein CK426_02795 [Legionella sp.]|nr:MAG: hypothetical protein CK423_07650 [Legionella sp.]PJD99379.1 MAG: hypothetical protein CK426_02795 [Legionella sp.]
MRLPFGPQEPGKEERELLLKLGFRFENMEKLGRYYFISTPDLPHLRCDKQLPDFDKIIYHVYYNDVRVILISQKTAICDSYIHFNIFPAAVEEALAKNRKENEDSVTEKAISPAQIRRESNFSIFSMPGLTIQTQPKSKKSALLMLAEENNEEDAKTACRIM